MTIIATICARAGSKGVPGKNSRELQGKPLIAHTIEQARQHPLIDKVFVSTDCAQLATIAKQYGAIVPMLRPKELATDNAPKLPVIQHLCDVVMEKIGDIEKIVDLDPTSPLRRESDITACIKLLDNDVDLVITGYDAEKNPYFNMVEAKENGNIGLVKALDNDVAARQLAPSVYSMNGSVYVWRPETLTDSLWGGRVKIHIMPRECSVDIDSEIDFKLVELLMMQKLEKA